MNFDGVLCIYVLLLHEGQAECHYSMFSICETNKCFSMHVIHYLCLYPFMLQHSYYVLLLELHLSCSCLEYFDPSFQCFKNILIKIVMVHVTLKIIFLSLTYSRTSRS